MFVFRYNRFFKIPRKIISYFLRGKYGIARCLRTGKLQCISPLFSEYNNNKTKRRAIERELEIIGEAMNRLLKLNDKISLSYTRMIVDLRNRILHTYDAIDETIIWKIIMKDIPILQNEIELLLNEK